jgi:hypothetical protein
MAKQLRESAQLKSLNTRERKVWGLLVENSIEKKTQGASTRVAAARFRFAQHDRC